MTVIVSVPVFAAASRAVTVITFCPLKRVISLTVQELVPVHVPLPPRSLDHDTWVTATLSEAEPPILRDEASVE